MTYTIERRQYICILWLESFYGYGHLGYKCSLQVLWEWKWRSTGMLDNAAIDFFEGLRGNEWGGTLLSPSVYERAGLVLNDPVLKLSEFKSIKIVRTKRQHGLVEVFILWTAILPSWPNQEPTEGLKKEISFNIKISSNIIHGTVSNSKFLHTYISRFKRKVGI